MAYLYLNIVIFRFESHRDLLQSCYSRFLCLVLNAVSLADCHIEEAQEREEKKVTRSWLNREENENESPSKKRNRTHFSDIRKRNETKLKTK